MLNCAAQFSMEVAKFLLLAKDHPTIHSLMGKSEDSNQDNVKLISRDSKMHSMQRLTVEQGIYCTPPTDLELGLQWPSLLQASTNRVSGT